MCKSPTKGLLFEWSHNMIFSRQTKMSELKKLGVGQITQLFISNSRNLVACKTGMFCSANSNAILGTNAIWSSKIDSKVGDDNFKI